MIEQIVFGVFILLIALLILIGFVVTVFMAVGVVLAILTAICDSKPSDSPLEKLCLWGHK